MIKLDGGDVEGAFQAMCDAAQLPMEAQMDKNYEEQVIAFILALNKNYEREQTYKGLWRKDSIEEIGQHLVHKGKRMEMHSASMENPPNAALTVGHLDEATDDALDAINYGAFIARKVHYAATEAGFS